MCDELHIKAEWDCWNGGKWSVIEPEEFNQLSGQDVGEFVIVLRKNLPPERTIVIDYGFGELEYIPPSQTPPAPL